MSQLLLFLFPAFPLLKLVQTSANILNCGLVFDQECLYIIYSLDITFPFPICTTH